MSERSVHRKQKVQTGSDITAHAIKTGGEGVAKGGVEAAETVSHFQYAPTLIALFPVFASFFFGSHTEHWTDLILLGLVAVYLHNCVTVPWGYYKASQRRYKTSNPERMTERQQTVDSQLRMAELQAFGGLIVGPLLGALLLNYVRSTMARPANGLITNFNITVFILAAELRPVRIAYEYLSKRSRALQEELTDVAPARYEALEKRIDDLVARLQSASTSNGDSRASIDAHAYVNGARSPREDNDVGQLKYALKKFEKYEANSKYELESKFYALERKLADLSARSQPAISTGSPVAQTIWHFLLFPIRLFWALFTAPLRLLQRTTSVVLRHGSP